MSTKKKISDIDKAIEEMQQRRDECSSTSARRCTRAARAG